MVWHLRKTRDLFFFLCVCSWMWSCGNTGECIQDIQLSDFNPSGFSCSKKCDCNNLKYEGYCDNGLCLTRERVKAERKGETRKCTLLQKVKTCTEGVQEAQPVPLKELLWGDCKPPTLEEENTRVACLDNLDNDCNGLVDLNDPACSAFCRAGLQAPCYAAALGTLNQGLCRSGIKTCGVENTWGPCAGEVAPKAELCDGQDNDCNGLIDDGVAGCQAEVCLDGAQKPCYTNLGGCVLEALAGGAQGFRCQGSCRTGLQRCQQGTWSSCEGQVASSEETCDNLDNDCDGLVDETCSCKEGEVRDCYLGPKNQALGECKAGKQTCTRGTWGRCDGAIAPSAEICDGKDNNCDGQVDEQCLCTKDADCPNGASCKEGKCEKPTCPAGQSRCVDACVDTQSSDQHCGMCNNACTSEKRCRLGKCECLVGKDECNGLCVDTKNSREHCGACGQACGEPRACREGKCECPNGGAFCAGSCVDTSLSNDHCGGCGKACAGGESCVAGRCESPLFLAAAETFSCAVTACRQLKCWGDNERGQLGYGDIVARKAPDPAVVDVGAGRFVKQVALGRKHTCALLDDGTVKCWGANSLGQLGYGDKIPLEKPPAKTLEFFGHKVKQLTSGWEYSCALLDDNTLRCWANNFEGQLGYGDKTTRYAPINKAIDLGMGRTAKQVVAGRFHACAILDNNAVKCWGANDQGQLGYGDLASRTSPDQAVINLGTGRSAFSLSLGERHTCAVLDDGTAKCWGANPNGLLGYGDAQARNAPDAMAINLGVGRSAKQIVTGQSHTCALLDTGEVKCWGWNNAGQLGSGDYKSRSAPDLSVSVFLGAGRVARQLVVGRDHTCALLDNDEVKCWGGNHGGQLGYGIDDNYFPAPTSSVVQLGQALCGGACIDTLASNQHCGACGVSCNVGQTCKAGACSP